MLAIFFLRTLSRNLCVLLFSYTTRQNELLLYCCSRCNVTLTSILLVLSIFSVRSVAQRRKRAPFFTLFTFTVSSLVSFLYGWVEIGSEIASDIVSSLMSVTDACNAFGAFLPSLYYFLCEAHSNYRSVCLGSVYCLTVNAQPFKHSPLWRVFVWLNTFLVFTWRFGLRIRFVPLKWLVCIDFGYAQSNMTRFGAHWSERESKWKRRKKMGKINILIQFINILMV